MDIPPAPAQLPDDGHAAGLRTSRYCNHRESDYRHRICLCLVSGINMGHQLTIELSCEGAVNKIICQQAELFSDWL